MLKIEDLVVAYGGIEALKGISLEVEEGQIVTLVGANGAGKSTTLRTVIGLVKPVSGRVLFKGRNLLEEKTYNMAKQQITLVPEGRRIFPKLTVLENLRIGAFSRRDEKGIKADLEWVFSLFPILKERTWQLAGTLSGGEQQMLAVGRALMSRPRLLMMDEPSLGLAPLLVKEIFRIIKEINQQGVTILLIEQNANAALRIADQGYVLETGRIVLQGPGRELLANQQVKAAYLGRSK
ncbi:MAG TPA: ABC transporter ATP-binding protein [Firmicutes bacterium]|uniref:ABC transporter ATP-binding protein n=1 Tax=Capillibacterium thermochitinicola TaxID=2699427 RepID=A0A8J6LNP9_9FIRM|nr:ABC transporter ATP-binding protein [Capillibacterium thermochitinicola]MBA2133908.1 ABC transporter ATP-binding protein [Capillibacterium thermochitinicola]HHW13205.1 ABC transporter ATP-binding protein [Bacillota bacterium]